MSWTTNQHEIEKWSEDCAAVVGEVRAEGVYDAIERLVQAAEQVGFTVPDLIQMLQTGMTLESLLDLIEIRMARTLRDAGARAA